MITLKSEDVVVQTNNEMFAGWLLDHKELSFEELQGWALYWYKVKPALPYALFVAICIALGVTIRLGSVVEGIVWGEATLLLIILGRTRG